MEKRSYETYEFLATLPANSDSETNQYFVLQDDGTILTVNKQIQYVTQAQENKSTMRDMNQAEGCATVFDVSSQQYYVDVDNSTPELISINDQFAISNGDNNVYASTYLIQPESSMETQQMETEPIIDPQKLDAQQLQQSNVEAFNGSKLSNDLTEITLTDEQYQILEQKGWILLESNERIFVLNTLGLHDITTNDKLIQKLKNELQDQETETKLGEIKIENVTSVFPNEINVKTADQQEICGDDTEFVIANNMPENKAEQVESVQFVIKDTIDEEMDEQEKPSETKEHLEVPIQLSNSNREGDEVNSGLQKPKCDSIKIKTKYTFEDIPDKIFLGKTVNGKKLYAKVTKVKNKNNSIIDMAKKCKPIEIYGKTIENIPHQSTGLDYSRFINIIQDSFRSLSETSLSVIEIQDSIRSLSEASLSVIESATSVISQLMALPNMKDTIIGANFVVTKIVTSRTEVGKEIGQPTMVTGTVKMRDGEGCFVHIPQMLQILLEKSETSKTSELDSIPGSAEGKTARDVIDLFHIHVSETRFVNKSPQTSINLSKRKFPLDLLNDAKKRHPNPVYACGSCGVVFNSEYLLKDHQNNECIEVDDELTIDTDEINKGRELLYSIIESGKEKLYSCLVCEAKFSRLFNCQKHLKTHKTNAEKSVKVYRCKMCPSTYFHSSSLSKHIVKTHIQMQKK